MSRTARRLALALCLFVPAALFAEDGDEPPALEPSEAPPEEAESPGEPPPKPGPADPSVKASFAKARALPINAITDVPASPAAPLWFRVDLKGEPQVVLRVGALNLPGTELHVFDERGAPYEVSPLRVNRPSGWHGKLAPGTYYVRLRPQEADETPRPLTPQEQLARQKANKATQTGPALQVMVDPVGPGLTPRRAAQLGLDYLTIDAPAWQNRAACNGCHIQSQALMGMALAKENGYRVQERAALSLGDFVSRQQESPGKLFAALAVRYHVSGFSPKQRGLLAEWARLALEERDEKGVAPAFDSGDHPPVQAGTLTGSAMAVQVLSEAIKSASSAERPKLTAARDAALEVVRKASARTVQDHAMRVIAFTEAGVKGRPLEQEVAALLGLQDKDGGFGESEGGGGSNAYGTGQALYALRIAGVSPESPAFSRAVRWLVEHQAWNGSWPLLATECSSDIAHTMWAVIGLAGSIRASLPVRVTAVVRNAKGDFVSDLRQEDFEVLEAGAAQRVLRFRRLDGAQHLVLVLDTSGSIKQALPTVVAAANAFGKVLSPKDKVALAPFSSRPAPVGDFSTDRAVLAKELGALKAQGGTALYDAIGVAVNKLKEVPEPKGIVLLTDGRDEDASGKRAGSRASLAATRALLKESGIPLFALGLGSGVEQDVLQKLAGDSGGRLFLVPSAQNLDAVYRGLAGALRSQYELVYESSRPTADGKWRPITVQVKRPGGQVEATPGYTATGELLQ